MRRKILFAIILFSLSVLAFQASPYARRIRPFSSTPSSCQENEIGYNMSSHSLVICTNSGYVTLATGGSGGTAAPTDATYITRTTNANLSAEFALGSLATGILKNTTTTGTPTIAVAGTDYESPLTFNSPLSRSTNTISCSTCGLTSNPLSQFASTTSSQLAGILSDKSGATGVFILANLSSLTINDVITWNGTNWVNQAVSGGGGALGTGNVSMTVANASSTGTTTNRLVKLTGAPSTAIITSTSDTENTLGVCTSGCGTTGSATIALLGQVNCDFDGSTTAGNFVINSSTSAGKCSDAGSSFPTSSAAIGKVLTTNVGIGTYSIELMTPDVAFQNGGNGKSKPGTPANSYQYNSSSTFAGGNLFRVDANTNQQSNTTNFQTFNLYKTTNSDSSPTNYERLQITGSTGSTAFTIASQTGGTGVARGIAITSDSSLTLSANNTIQTGGSTTQVIPGTTNTVSLGSATNFWSNLNATNVTAAQNGNLIFSSATRLAAGSNSYTLQVLDTNSNSSTLAFAPRNFTANSGNNNDPDFGTGSYFYRITPNASGSTLTGSRGSTITGEIHQITNVSTALLTLANQNTNSTAGNRWLSNTGLDINLAADEIASYINDGTTARQRVGKFETSDIAVVTTQFDKTSSTALADITFDRTFNVSASRTYSFEFEGYTTSNVAGGVKFAIGGTATATAIIYEALVDDAAVLAAQTRTTTLGNAVGGITAVTNAKVKITGTITVNAAGTLTVQFAQNASNGTASSVLVGSIFTITKVR